jgi:hypothetical protein
LKLAIRVDDFGWKQNSDPDRGLLVAQRFHAALQGLPYIAGVIPSTTDHDSLAWLQSKPEGLTVALHGFNHAMSADGVASEFRGLDQRQSRQRIGWGLGALKDIQITDMILPFNAYEPDLGEACYLEGIRRIWGGGSHDRTTPSYWPTPPQPYSVGRMCFVPSWNPTYGATQWRMGESPALIDTLPKLKNLPGKAVVTLHITWEYSKSKAFDGVKWLADTIGNQVISPEDYLK